MKNKRWDRRCSKKQLARRFWTGSLAVVALLLCAHFLIGCADRQKTIEWGGDPITVSYWGLLGPTVTEMGNTVDRQKVVDCFATAKDEFEVNRCRLLVRGRTPSDNPEARQGRRGVSGGRCSINTTNRWYDDCSGY